MKAKNIIIHGFGQPRLQPALYKILKEGNISHAEIITVKHSFRAPVGLEDYTVYDHRELAYCDYPLKPFEQVSLPAKLLEDLRPCEAVVLKMLEREEKWKGPLSYNERKSIYLRHLRYWNHIIQTKGIDWFVSINIPHSIYDYVILKLCQNAGIPCILTNQNIPDFLQVLTSDSDIAAFSSERAEFNGELKDLPIRAQTVIYKQTGQGNKMPAYSGKEGQALGKAENSETFKGSMMTRVKKHLGSGNFRPLFTHTVGKVATRLKDRKLWREYRKYAKKVSLEEDYIYVALHYQPEMSTCPLGGVFVDQDLAIAVLAEAATALGIKVYVKEHFAQKSFGRKRTLYRELHEYPNVTLVEMETPSRELIKNAICVATITGTTAWEALFENTPAMVFGDCFHEAAPGIAKIRSAKEAQEFLKSIRDGQCSFDVNDLASYLEAFDKHAAEGNIATGYEMESRTGPDTATNLANAILSHLN